MILYIFPNIWNINTTVFMSNNGVANTYLIAAFPLRIIDSLDTTLMQCFHWG